MCTISVVILTGNEEKNIERCLGSLLWCDEIIIIDDYSEDRTIERIKYYVLSIKYKKPKIRFYKRRLNNDFSSQRNFGLKEAKGEWVLFVDADEVISDELASEIKSEIRPFDSAQDKNPKSEICGYYLKRKDYFLGKWLKYGETGSIRLLRLGKKLAGRWQGRIHEVWEIKRETKELKNPILHYPHGTVTEFLNDINTYTDLVAQYWKEKGRDISPWEIVFYPLGKFFHNYILRLGFLDRGPGIIIAGMMSFHSFLARSKYWLMRHNGKNS